MKNLKKILSILLIISFLVACKDELAENEVRIDFTNEEAKGQNYEEFIVELQNKGFTNIDVIVFDDLILGWLTEDGEIEEVTINDSLEYTSGSVFNNDAYIVVSYHTFPVVSEEENYDEEESYVEEPEQVLENLTIENNKDLAYLLSANDTSTFGEFSDKYYGQQIEFDGNICAMANHGNYTTRYDLLICAGDFDENSMPGPSFKYEDINLSYDFHLVGENQPDYIGVGDNFHFVATVGYYDEDKNLFYLDPVSSELR